MNKTNTSNNNEMFDNDIFSLPESNSLFTKNDKNFTQYEINNIINILDKLNKIGFSRNSTYINNNDINLCNKLLHFPYTKTDEMKKMNMLDYNQKRSLERLVNKYSKYKYSNSAFDKLCALVELYNINNQDGGTQLSVSLDTPENYILGNQIGFLLNEDNKKIYRLNNKNNRLSLQKIVDLRDVHNIPSLENMENIPITYLDRLEDLKQNKINIGDEIFIRTNSNDKYKCTFFDSIGNCIKYCSMFKRV